MSTMTAQLVPSALLEKSDKILFVAHLALGDFTYMQNCFRAFSAAFPHIKIHLWVDELRRTSDETQWEHLKKYSLYDWVNSCPMFDKIYCQTYSPQLFKQSVKEVQAENYPIVISLAVLHRHRYASLIRQLSPRGFTVGQKKKVRLLDIHKHLLYRKLDAFIPAYQITRQHQSGELPVPHISDIYADWFLQLFNLHIPKLDRFPFVDIPEEWLNYAQQQFIQWGFHPGEKTLFLNGFSKSKERSLSLLRVFSLAQTIKKHPDWRHARFIINVVPECMTESRALYDSLRLENVHLFSAGENFFQLPAILSFCQLIISVETAVMHLANAVQVPVIALMRLTSPEWVPINAELTRVVTVSHRKAWVDEITEDQVLDALPSEQSGWLVDSNILFE